MAILKCVNTSNNGREKLTEMLSYIKDKNKIKNQKGSVISMTDNPKISWMVNRWLHGTEDAKKHFFHYIIALEEVWSPNQRIFKMQHKKMGELALKCNKHFEDMGFLPVTSIHCNTKHLHIHILLETCNYRTGKQYTQSRKELSNLKETVSNWLLSIGFSESVRQNVTISESEMLGEDSIDFFREEYEPEEISDYEIVDEEIPIETYLGMSSNNYPNVLMAHVIDNSAPRILCRKVDNTTPRLMTRVINKE